MGARLIENNGPNVASTDDKKIFFEGIQVGYICIKIFIIITFIFLLTYCNNFTCSLDPSAVVCDNTHVRATFVVYYDVYTYINIYTYLQCDVF